MDHQNWDLKILYRKSNRTAMTKTSPSSQKNLKMGKWGFWKGILSFDSGFSSKFAVKNYEFWLRNEASRFFLGKSFDSFSADPHHKVRKATCIGKLHSLSFYSFSLQDLLEGFIQVMLHFNSLGYPLKMVSKACFKMEIKQGIKHGIFWENGSDF